MLLRNLNAPARAFSSLVQWAQRRPQMQVLPEHKLRCASTLNGSDLRRRPAHGLGVLDNWPARDAHKHSTGAVHSAGLRHVRLGGP